MTVAAPIGVRVRAGPRWRGQWRVPSCQPRSRGPTRNRLLAPLAPSAQDLFQNAESPRDRLRRQFLSRPLENILPSRASQLPSGPNAAACPPASEHTTTQNPATRTLTTKEHTMDPRHKASVLEGAWADGICAARCRITLNRVDRSSAPAERPSGRRAGRAFQECAHPVISVPRQVRPGHRHQGR